VVQMIDRFSWRVPFVVFGMLGLIWAAVWYWYYRDTPAEHKSVSQQELEVITGSLGAGAAKGKRQVPWRVILSRPQVWNLSVMYFCYGYCLAVYLDWFPKYLNSHRGYDLKTMGLYASLPLLAGTLGDLAGGWISDIWAHRTGNLKLARRGCAILGFVIAGAAIIPATLTADPFTCVLLSCLAFFGLEFTVGVSWAVPLDIGGDFAGSVSAVMNTCGNMGGAISGPILAYLVGAYSWDAPFLVASALCVLAAVLFMRIDASRRIFTE
jgi:sugar phosphate permease